MTIRKGAPGMGLRLAVMGALLIAAGCNTAADDPVFTRQAAANTGTFPNLNVAPPVATTQFTPYSLAQHNATIAAAQQDHTAQTAVADSTVAEAAAEQARLRALRNDHAKATIDAIEGN